MKIDGVVGKMLEGLPTEEFEEARAEQKAKGGGEIEHDSGADTWEVARQPEPEGVLSRVRSTVSDGVNTAPAGTSAIQEALGGKDSGEALRGLAEVAQFFGPSVETIETYREVRESVQGVVKEQVEHLREAPLGEGIAGLIEDPEGLATAITDALDAAPVKLRAMAADRAATAVNQVAGAVGEVLLEHRAIVDVPSMGLKIAAANATENHERLYGDMLFPPGGLGTMAAAWCLAAAGEAIGQSVEVAEYFTQTPGLLTRANFDEWVDSIEPGGSRRVEAGLSIRGSMGLGGFAGQERAVVLERTRDNRALMTVEISGEGGALAGLNAQGIGKGVSAGVTAGASVTLDFNLESEADRRLLAEYMLASKTGLPPERLVKNLPDRVVAVEFSGGAAAGLNVGASVVGADAGVEGKVVTRAERRDEGTVVRQGMSFGGSAQVDGSLVRVPDEWAAGLVALAGGEVGGRGELDAQVEIGREFVDGSVQRIYLEAEISGAALGREGTVKIQAVLHNPDSVPGAVGEAADEIRELFANDNLGTNTLMEALSEPRSAIDEVYGLQVTVETAVTSGLRVDTFGAGVASTTTGATEMTVLIEEGTMIDRTLQPTTPREEAIPAWTLGASAGFVQVAGAGAAERGARDRDQE